MPIIRLLGGFIFDDIRTDPLFRVRVTCPHCHGSRVYSPTLSMLQNIMDDYTVHRNANNQIQWAEGNTRLLRCPACNGETQVYLAIHRSGTVICARVGSVAWPEWWVIPPE